jgi:hypothetical protein
MFKVADGISKDAFYIAADDWTRQEGESWQAGKRYGALTSALNLQFHSSPTCWRSQPITASTRSSEKTAPAKDIWTLKPKQEP